MLTPERLLQLNQGAIESSNLTENLAIDQSQLLLALPLTLFSEKQQKELHEKVHSFQKLGIAKKMAAIAAELSTLLNSLPESARKSFFTLLLQHSSDTVRSWCCFIIAENSDWPTFQEKLTAIAPLAKDPHFGVREWAWLGLRSLLIEHLEEAIEIFKTWVTHSNPYIRRYAIESIRPCGVWSKHIHKLKEHPEWVLPLLEQLRSDPDRYVQNSVANWLNDASKSQADWVSKLCQEWIKNSNDKATLYIVKRAMRTLQKNST